MMIERTDKVFIDSNMIIYAADFQRADVFEWMNQLYSNIYIHTDVYRELLFSSVKEQVNRLIDRGDWTLFDPEDSDTMSTIQRDIYRQRLQEVKSAFHKMNIQRIIDGKRPKTVSNLGEIATITACMMIGAGIICSNDFDIRTVVAQEDYRVIINAQEILLMQDSAEDFCTYCFHSKIATRKLIRNFYKTIIGESKYREQKLRQLDERLQDMKK